LDDVLTKWAAERLPRAEALHEWSMVVRKFTERHGAMPVSAIEKAHVILCKDKLVEAKKAAGTIRNDDVEMSLSIDEIETRPIFVLESTPCCMVTIDLDRIVDPHALRG